MLFLAVFLGQMALVLRRDKTTGDSRTTLPQKDEQEKARGPALISARKLCELAHELDFTARLVKTRPAIPPFYIDIIPWRRLGHTVLVFHAGSQIRVQSGMPVRDASPGCQSRMPVPDTVVNPVVCRG